MKRACIALFVALGALVGVAQAPAPVSAASSTYPPVKLSPPGQVVVVTVNAQQVRVLDVYRFGRFRALVDALRTRPSAFDGGTARAVDAPDVIVVQEMRSDYEGIFENLLRDAFPYNYSVVGSVDAAATFVVNTDAIGVDGPVQQWSDVCTSEETPSDSWSKRDYQHVRLRERATGAVFTTAGVEFAKRYTSTGDCTFENVRALRDQLDGLTEPTIIGGDFNRRAVDQQYECDPDETSGPRPWWTLLADGTDGSRAYVDAVRESRRNRGGSMHRQWTWESRSTAETCAGTVQPRRSRIDYLFASGADIADARADDPGWSAGPPGTRHPARPVYSDHRFVWGRFVVSGPGEPAAPVATPIAGGAIDLSWAPLEGATGWRVYRAKGKRRYARLVDLAAGATTFRDVATTHGATYRYALAALGADSGQGVESAAVRAKADSKGPRPVRLYPRAGASATPRDVVVRATFDESFDAARVGSGTLRVFANGKRLAGTLAVSGRSLSFDPVRPLRRKQAYRAVVMPLVDSVGNFGERVVWRFEA